VVLIGSVFAIVVLHELGHALVARRFGISTRDITLYPIGGIARLERFPERPAQELLVAIAGPLVNVVLAFAIYAGLVLSGVDPVGSPFSIGNSFAVQLMWINVSLALFNLLPAFPMDGGRVLRAVLSFRIERARATAIAAWIGRGFAVLLALVGLASSTMLVVIAAFIWISAGHEAAIEELRTSLRGVRVDDAMVDRFQILRPTNTLATAARLLANGFQHDFPVVEDGRVVGLLTREGVVLGLATRPSNTPVSFLMHRSFSSAGETEELGRALERMRPDGSSVVVLRNDEPVGILDPAHIENVVAMRRLGRQSARAPTAA
jgi:Zn-dependent protease